jgi:hypothetical protein
MCELRGRQVAAISPQSEPAAGTVWTTYLASDNADATAAKATAAGGHVLAEPFDVMDAGRMFVATDPGGAIFGVWQAGAHTGMQLANEVGSVTWNENMSRDYEGNKAFYGSVFGYKFGDIGAPDMKYATLDLPGGMVGGIGEIGPEQLASRPAGWGTYFGVADTDAAIARVTELGGSVIAPAWDSPYGRMAVVADDQGAEFAIMSVSSGEGS